MCETCQAATVCTSLPDVLWHAAEFCRVLVEARRDDLLGVLPHRKLSRKKRRWLTLHIRELERIHSDIASQPEKDFDVELASICNCSRTLGRLLLAGLRTVKDVMHYDRDLFRAILVQAEYLPAARQHQLYALVAKG